MFGSTYAPCVVFLSTPDSTNQDALVAIQQTESGALCLTVITVPIINKRQAEFNFAKGGNMQKFLVLVVFLGLLSLPLMAQDYPKAEVFGGSTPMAGTPP